MVKAPRWQGILAVYARSARRCSCRRRLCCAEQRGHEFNGL